jgi:hypothetical protein
MKQHRPHGGFAVLAFTGPFVAGLNAAILWGNESYDAQPWKIALASALFFVGAWAIYGLGEASAKK